MKYDNTYYPDELYHHGIKGMKWGVRRFQKKNGTMTNAGEKRYLDSDGNVKKVNSNDINSFKDYKKHIDDTIKNHKEIESEYRKEAKGKSYSEREELFDNVYDKKLGDLKNEALKKESNAIKNLMNSDMYKERSSKIKELNSQLDKEYDRLLGPNSKACKEATDKWMKGYVDQYTKERGKKPKKSEYEWTKDWFVRIAWDERYEDTLPYRKAAEKEYRESTSSIKSERNKLQRSIGKDIVETELNDIGDKEFTYSFYKYKYKDYFNEKIDDYLKSDTNYLESDLLENRWKHRI